MDTSFAGLTVNMKCVYVLATPLWMVVELRNEGEKGKW